MKPYNYYFDENNKIYKSCSSSCDECNFPNNNTFMNCIKCKPDYYITEDTRSCYKEGISDYYLDNDTLRRNNQYLIKNEKNHFTISLNKSIISNEQIKHEFKINNIPASFATINFYKKYKSSNYTTLDLGPCEYILKDIYNISYNKTLYILSLEIPLEGMTSPKIEYEVYYINEENKLILLNLSHCKNEKMEISIPMILLKDNVDVYNPESGYYNDLCYIYTTNFGTDISLKDRRKEFFDKNLAICEENCDLKDYNYINKKVICSCEIKTGIDLIKDVVYDKEKIKNNFKDINNFANIKFLTCYKIAFKRKNLLPNIGFYIMDFIFLLYFICLFLFYYKYYHPFFEEIKKVFLDLKNEYIITNNDNSNNNSLNKNDFIGKNKKILRTKKKFKKTKKKFNKKIKNEIPINEKNQNMFDGSKSNNNLKLENKCEKIKTENSKILEYNDSELNSLSYDDALKYDKRTYIKYYISLLKMKHLLIFSFYPNKDYNSRIIKILLFFCFFATELSLNALFFDDETMHQIYEAQGSYDFSYQLPKIVYSSLLSLVFMKIFTYFSLTENNIIDLKEEIRNKSNEINEKIKKLYKKLKIKFALFFAISPSIIFGFWFYVTCFCGIYKNTQIDLIRDTLFSFITSFIFPFVTLLIPGLFRKIALNTEKKRYEIFI